MINESDNVRIDAYGQPEHAENGSFQNFLNRRFPISGPVQAAAKPKPYELKQTCTNGRGEELEIRLSINGAVNEKQGPALARLMREFYNSVIDHMGLLS